MESFTLDILLQADPDLLVASQPVMAWLL